VTASPGATKRYRLRPATSADAEELFRIHLEAMGPYLPLAFADWSEAADREHHQQWMQDGRAQAIVVDDRIAGSFELVRHEDALWLRRLELDPGLHGRGLGTQILEDVQQQAGGQALRVVLDVFVHNPARRLYERLGFVEVGREGPSIKMEWRPHEPRSADGQ
jgi:RimJ/RimL family protein N-acetyltransferase